MLGIILTGHGGFASGLYQATVQIIGEQPQFVAVNFPDGMSNDLLAEQLQKALLICDKGDGVIFLTDILGGSPFRCSALLSYQYKNSEVLTGTNLQLLIEMLLAREEFDLVSFRDTAIDIARKGITSLWHESQQEKMMEDHDDGI